MNDVLRRVGTQNAETAIVAGTRDEMHNAVIDERVWKQQAALLEIVRSGVLAHDLQCVYERLTEITAETLGVARVSIWRLSKDGTALELADLFELQEGRHVAGHRLLASQYPAYFNALNSSRILSVTDAQLDPRTSEFKLPFLAPLLICSMLDVAIWHGGESHGVVCVESVNERRAWTPDEQQFAGSIADLVMLAIENHERRTTQTRLLASEERFTQVFHLSPDWMVITRKSDGVVLEVNASFEHQSGYAADEVVGRTTRDIGLWAIPEQRESWLAQSSGKGVVRAMETEFRAKSGDIRTFQLSAELITLGDEACLISIARDITESKRQEKMVFEIAQGVAANTGETFFRSLVERLLQALDADLAFVGELTGSDRRQVQTIAVQQRGATGNPFTYSLDGSPCEQILGQGICAFPSDAARLFPNDRALVEKGIQGYVGAPLVDSAGCAMGLIAVLFKNPIQQAELAIQLLRIFATRASAELERRTQLAELEYRANHDLLTGLFNRATLERQIKSDIATSTRESQRALLIVDLDRFREINDTLGHSVGDSLLIRIARRLASENEVGTMCRGVVARLGGDEFAIWLYDIDGPHIAEQVAARALAAITAPFEIEGYRLEVGASIGIAHHPQHGATASDLLRCADVAMYVAKRKGTGYGVYKVTEDPHSPKRLSLLSQLGDAVREGQLELHYQPRMDLSQRIPSGFEALVRWRHPSLGLLPPSQFIPLAELSDVIRPLTIWVLDEALGWLKNQLTSGRSLNMSVNLSARHLVDEACPDQVMRLLDKHGVDSQRLELEITESALIADPERAAHTLQRIHDMGVKISVDDFGTGYSSLSHLRRLPLNALKIDVSFVTHMLTNEQDAAIVESTIALAHNLKMSVVADGIEDEKIASRLRALGCDEGQGYLFGRPMPAAEVSTWLCSHAG